MVAMRFVPTALLGLVGVCYRYGGTRGLHALWMVVGPLVMRGSSGMTDHARAYIEQRKQQRKQARQAAEDEATRRATGSESNQKSGGSGRRSRHL